MLEYWLKGEDEDEAGGGKDASCRLHSPLAARAFEAARAGEGEKLRFGIEEIEVELEVATSQDDTAEGGWDQWWCSRSGPLTTGH